MIILALFALLLNAQNAYTAPLSVYRDQLGSRKAMETAALSRAMKLRQSLTTGTATFAPMQDSRHPFHLYARGTRRGTKASTTTRMKEYFQAAIEELRKEETRLKPPIFDP